MKIDRLFLKTVENGFSIEYYENSIQHPYGWQSKTAVFRTWDEVVVWISKTNKHSTSGKDN